MRFLDKIALNRLIAIITSFILSIIKIFSPKFYIVLSKMGNAFDPRCDRHVTAIFQPRVSADKAVKLFVYKYHYYSINLLQ